MTKKLNIGLIFSYNEQWIGGTYYTLNLIAALNLLEDNIKPELTIFSTEKDFAYLKTQVQYQYLNFELLGENPGFNFLRLINKVGSKLLKRKLIKRRFRKSIDAIFPYSNNNYLSLIPVEKRIFWIPDFQEKHYPEFYSQYHLDRELEVNTSIVLTSKKLLLSSKDALTDLKTYYPNFKTKPYVVHFAVKTPDVSTQTADTVLQKFQLPNQFYFAPNQFWRHKNQFVLIQAVEQLKKQGVTVTVAFSGKENDPRSPGYTQNLKDYVAKNNLSDQIRFLGFLDREDQLKLMEICTAVIQPSLFEGWSTVIEEAMAFNKVVIASDLPVNIEQLGERGYYFERTNPNDLARVIQNNLESSPTVKYDYYQKQYQFALDFMACVKG